jgi:hypothetical protein
MYQKVHDSPPYEAWHVVRLHTSTHFFSQPQTKAGALAIFVASNEGDPAARRGAETGDFPRARGPTGRGREPVP